MICALAGGGVNGIGESFDKTGAPGPGFLPDDGFGGVAAAITCMMVPVLSCGPGASVSFS